MNKWTVAQIARHIGKLMPINLWYCELFLFLLSIIYYLTITFQLICHILSFTMEFHYLLFDHQLNGGLNIEYWMPNKIHFKLKLIIFNFFSIFHSSYSFSFKNNYSVRINKKKWELSVNICIWMEIILNVMHRMPTERHW